MNESILFKRQRAWLSGGASLVFAAIFALAGCGGVGTGGTGSFTALSGYAADGYLVNATVFLDKHGNYQWDGVEPSATTDANGAYTLNVDPADVGKYPIVVLALAGKTIDKDNNPGMTPLTSSYVFSMPAAAVSGTAGSNFVSPMSSMVRELMETGNYATMQQAMDALNAQMGLAAGTDVMVDYMATSNTTLHTVAQDMVTLMASQMSQILSTNGSTTTVDVNRYRAMMGTIFTDMPSMMGSNSQGTMAALIGAMTTTVSNIPATGAGQPFKNMSAAFRGGMM